jgi:hypothetical protein
MVAGVLMSGPLKTTFLSYLREIYPNTFFYYSWSDEFYFWDLFEDAAEFVDTDKPVYIFIGEGQEKNLEPIIERLAGDFPGYNPEVTLLQHFTPHDEYFYEVRFR